MVMQKKTVGGMMAALMLVSGVALFGCSDQTKEAASDAMSGAAQDTQNHVQAADSAVKETGHDVAVAGHDAAVATKDAAHNAAVATDQAVKKTDDAVKSDAHYVGKAVGGTVKGAAIAAHDAGKVVTMTPTVKDALIRSNIDTSSVNVDTDAKTNTVSLTGSVPTAAQKSEASQIAKSTIASSGHEYTLKNELTVK